MPKHATPIRGLMSAPSSPSFQGRFGRMFHALPGATFGDSVPENEANLKVLSKAMEGPDDNAKDGMDDEESAIPSLYTYFGQFIDHDLTFDPNSSLQKQNDPDALTDYRSPAFDLDCVYGRGPDDQPYLYDGKKFFAGKKLTNGAMDKVGATDLLRNPLNDRAIIGDPRNDENTIVSQFQGLVQRFHNRLMTDEGMSFADAQQTMRFHYQYVILHDFLPRIIHVNTLNKLKNGGHFEEGKLEFYHWRNNPFMPVEFSGACYRFGHSMVRPGYRLNDHPDNLLSIFPQLVGFGSVQEPFALDWGRFIDVEKRKGDDSSDAVKMKRLQFAYRIDTSLVEPLANLPTKVADMPPISLGERNLVRGWTLGLPNGQAVAKAMGIIPLKDSEIIIGQALNPDKLPLPNPDIITAVGNAASKMAIDELLKVNPNATDAEKKVVGDAAKVQPMKTFKENCPLWTYILAEAMHHVHAMDIPTLEGGKVNTPQLGPVGGRIVAEVFLGLMYADQNSMLNLDRLWHPVMGDYKLKDFVNYALGN